MRKKLPRVLVILGVVGALVLLLLIWVGISLFGPAPAIVVSRETTYLTEPLAANGLPDYARALLDRQRAGVTPENNGAIPFWQAMWPGELSPEDQRLLLAELGMDEPQRGIVNPVNNASLRRELISLLYPELSYEDADYKANRLLEGMGQPWTAAQIPPLAAWLEENERLLDLLVESGNRREFYSPSPALLDDTDESLMQMSLPALTLIRAAVRLLGTRAYFRMANGQYHHAWTDLQACLGLARHLDRPHTLLHKLVSVASANFVYDANLHLLNQPDLPADIAREILARYESRKPRCGVSDAIDQGERFGFLDTVVGIAHGRAIDFETAESPANIDMSDMISIDWNVILDSGNRWYDRLVAAGRNENWEERQEELDRFDQDFVASRPTSRDFVVSAFSTTRRSRVFAYLFEGLFVPVTQNAYVTEDRASTRRELIRIAAALTVYRGKNRTYPDELVALVPDVLPAIPVDLFHDRPFRYEKTAGGYLLYSCGANGVDESGSHDELRFYQGYDTMEYDETLLRKLLHEAANGNGHDDSAAADALPPANKSLQELIPINADDHAIRLPPPVIPLPAAAE